MCCNRCRFPVGGGVRSICRTAYPLVCRASGETLSNQQREGGGGRRTRIAGHAYIAPGDKHMGGVVVTRARVDRYRPGWISLRAGVVWDGRAADVAVVVRWMDGEVSRSWR